MDEVFDVLIIGGGPAGLQAATVLSHYNCTICLLEAMPTVGRKFLMAGKSGLNITTAKENFLEQYGESEEWITPMIKNFGPVQIVEFCNSLEQAVFEGSSKKIFPVSLKSSPLLRAWLVELRKANVDIRTSSKWVDFTNVMNRADKGEYVTQIVRGTSGDYSIRSKVTILALGGASWCKLGSDGRWAGVLAKYLFDKKNSITSFSAANMGIKLPWSKQMLKYEGKPVKSVAIKINGKSHKGEFMLSRNGVEGSLIYLFSTMNSGELKEFELDLLPDININQLTKKLSRPRGKSTTVNFLRKSLGLIDVKFGLLREFGYPFPSKTSDLANLIKNLKVNFLNYYPMDYAISTKGGVSKVAVNDDLMLRELPGVFCAGEMLDWSAPTGGCLLTGCFSTGSHVGKAVAKYLSLQQCS